MTGEIPVAVKYWLIKSCTLDLHPERKLSFFPYKRGINVVLSLIEDSSCFCFVRQNFLTEF